MPYNWSLALTRSAGNQWQVIVSAEVAQYVTNKQKNVEDLRQALNEMRSH